MPEDYGNLSYIMPRCNSENSTCIDVRCDVIGSNVLQLERIRALHCQQPSRSVTFDLCVWRRYCVRVSEEIYRSRERRGKDLSARGRNNGRITSSIEAVPFGFAILSRYFFLSLFLFFVDPGEPNSLFRVCPWCNCTRPSAGRTFTCAYCQGH